MKKRWIAGALAGFLAMNVLTVSAQDLSNVEPAGNTEVTANVSAGTLHILCLYRKGSTSEP